MSSADDERVLTLEKVTDLLKDVIIKENVIDPVFDISSGAAKGDGFTSFMTKVIVRGKNKVLPLIIKCAPEAASIRNVVAIRVSFLQEIKYYEEIFPAFKKFQLDKSLAQPFSKIPICYKTVNADLNEMLVLENIKEKGFIPFNRKKQMDEAHVEMILKTYGQFHAISYAMKEQDYLSFEKLLQNIDPLYTPKNISKDFFDMFEYAAEQLSESFDKEKEADIYNYFLSWKNNVVPVLMNQGNYTGKYGVLIHGDCWCNNMMFKYEEENSSTPTDIRLFDFQGGCLTSPVYDISYFFYVTASEKMLDNLDHYLKIYHDSLSSYTSKMGTNIDDHYPFSALKEEWKQYGKFGLVLAAGVYRVMYQDEDAILDLSDNLSPKDTFMRSSKYDQLITEKYRKIGLHFYNNKFL